MSDVAVQNNPYETVDWGSVEYHKIECHMHSLRENTDYPLLAHEMVDAYAGQGPGDDGHTLPDGEEYTFITMADKSWDPLPWPWTDFETIIDQDGIENRDPVEMGVVAVPGTEVVATPHLIASCIEIDDRQLKYGGNALRNSIESVVEQEELHNPSDVGGMAWLAHPTTHTDGDEWLRIKHLFDKWSHDDGFLGLEAMSKEQFAEDLWDRLLTRFAPDRPVWGFGADDTSTGQASIGGPIDRRQTTLLLEPGDFDPDNQQASLEAAAQAMRDGRMTISIRDEWDPETDEYPTTPKINEIYVADDGTSITIDSQDYDSIEWVCCGEVVETGETIELGPEHMGYVRANLHKSSSADATTTTQPFYLNSHRHATGVKDAEFTDATFNTEQ